jgi:hypothetical protein
MPVAARRADARAALAAVVHPRDRMTHDMIRVDEYRENGALVIRAELGGIDPERDVETT